jgi:hypothetical protein
LAYGDVRFFIALTCFVGATGPACVANVRVDPGDTQEPKEGGISSGAGGMGGAPAASGGASNGLTTAAEEAACSKYVRARSERSETCGGATYEDFDCTSELFANGTTRTPQKVEACAGVIATSSCESLEKQLPECVSPGTLPAGAPCISGTQCASHMCTALNPALTECGQCIRIAERDGTCDGQTVVCGAGQTCVGTVGAGKCVDDSSVPIRTVGAGERCDAMHWCGAEASCEFSSGPAVCKPYPRAGEPCETFCFEGGCAISSGRCEPLPKLGEPCLLTNYVGGAVAGMCDGEDVRCLDRKCVAIGKPGDPCEPQDEIAQQCKLGECRCVGGDCSRYACAEKRYPGESCADTYSFCQQPAQCVAGVCVSGRLGKPHTDPCRDKASN